MKKLLGTLFILFLSINNVNAACDDNLSDGVDYTNCQFSDEQNLTGSYLTNSNLSFTGFIKVNFDPFNTELNLYLISLVNGKA